MSTITVTMADQINEHVRQAEQCLRTAVEHAWNAGRLLDEQKRLLDHGDWLPWLEQNVNLSARRAQEWMDLAASYTRAPAHLTIEDALKDARRDRRPDPRGVGKLLQGLGEGTRTPGQIEPTPGKSLESVVVWTERRARLRERASGQLEQLQSAVADASVPSLGEYAVAETLRRAAIEARQLASSLDELAFSFE